MMRRQHRERGSTLLISLVLLVMLTLFVLTVINTTNINSRIAGNMQTQSEAQAAAQQAIEQVISVNFPANPLATTVLVDINNDGTTDYTAQVAQPSCTRIVPIKTIQLDITKPDDAACLGSGASQASGIVGVGGAGDSLCANTQWDVNATVLDATSTGVSVSVHQGVAVRVSIDTSC